MIEILLYALEIVIFGLLSIGLFKLNTRYGLIPFYMFLAGIFIYGNITTGISLFRFLDFSIAGTAVTIVPLILFAFIIVCDLRSVEEARRFIFGIVLTSLLLIFVNSLFLIKAEYLLSPLSPFDFELLYTLLHPNTSILLFSILGFVASAFLLFVIYNFLSGISKYKFINVFISLTLALYIDSLIFTGGLCISGLASPGILQAHIVTKTFASFLYSAIYIAVGSFILPEADKKIDETSGKMMELDELRSGFGGSTDNRLKILVADDSPKIIALLKQIFKFEDWQFVEAHNGKEALGMVFAEGPDIILLDIMMPEMDGYEVVDILKSHRTTKDIPVIMITAKAETDEKLQGMGLGIDDYITKPFLPEEVVARIKMIMRRSAK